MMECEQIEFRNQYFLQEHLRMSYKRKEGNNINPNFSIYPWVYFPLPSFSIYLNYQGRSFSFVDGSNRVVRVEVGVRVGEFITFHGKHLELALLWKPNSCNRVVREDMGMSEWVNGCMGEFNTSHGKDLELALLWNPTVMGLWEQMWGWEWVNSTHSMEST